MQQNIIIQFFKSHRLLVCIYLPVAIVHGVSTLLLPLVTGAFFDVHFKTITGKSRLLDMLGISLGTTQQFFVFFAASIATRGLLAYSERQLSLTMAERFSFSLSRSLFEAQMRWPHEYFSRKPFGKYLLRYSGELTGCRNLLMKGWLGIVKHGCIFLSGVGLLLMISHLLTIQLLLSMLLILPFVYRLSRQQGIITELRNRKSGLLSFITESFSNHRHISASQAARENSITQFSKKQALLMIASSKNRQKQSMLYAFTSIAGYTFVIVLLACIVITPDLHMNPSDVLLYMLVLFTLLSTIRSLLRIPAVFQKGKASLKKASGILYADTILQKKKPEWSTVT